MSDHVLLRESEEGDDIEVENKERCNYHEANNPASAPLMDNANANPSKPSGEHHDPDATVRISSSHFHESCNKRDDDNVSVLRYHQRRHQRYDRLIDVALEDYQSQRSRIETEIRPLHVKDESAASILLGLGHNVNLNRDDLILGQSTSDSLVSNRIMFNQRFLMNQMGNIIGLSGLDSLTSNVPADHSSRQSSLQENLINRKSIGNNFDDTLKREEFLLCKGQMQLNIERSRVSQLQKQIESEEKRNKELKQQFEALSQEHYYLTKLLGA